MQGHRKGHCRIGGASVFTVLLFISAGVLLAAGQTSVTTYHYDNYRTGWNQSETVLTPANVGSRSFGLLQAVALDDQVDAQPLVVPGVQITAGKYQGLHDVVYVATEGNTVYAIDVHSGTVLLSPKFGTPVPMPLGCNNNGPNVGINSTPVIDPESKTLYVMVYTQDPTGSGLPPSRARSGELDRQSRTTGGRGVAHSDRWNDIHFQRDVPATASGVIARERQHLCGVWQLLRLWGESFAGLAAGVDGGNAGAVSV